MTKTNQAFIKMYRHDAAQAGDVSPGIAEGDRLSTAAVRASVQFVGAAMEHGTRSVERSSIDARWFDTSIDVLPPLTDLPASRTSLMKLKSGLGESGRRAERHEPALRRDNASATTKRPLSAFLARQLAPRPAFAPPITAAPPAGVTVASFRWPPVCRALSHGCAAEFNRIADVLLEEVAGGRAVFGVMSLFAGGGGTTVAACLAAHLAAGGRRTVLVEGNFYTPCLAAWLEVVPAAGWQDVLADAASLDDAVVRADNDPLEIVVQSATRPFDPLPLVAGRPAKRAADFLRQRYELALVDLGAFFDPRSQPVALELARNMGIEAVLPVAGPQPADPRDLATLAEHLGQSGCELLGVIENRIGQTSASRPTADP